MAKRKDSRRRKIRKLTEDDRIRELDRVEQKREILVNQIQESISQGRRPASLELELKATEACLQSIQDAIEDGKSVKPVIERLLARSDDATLAAASEMLAKILSARMLKPKLPTEMRDRLRDWVGQFPDVFVERASFGASPYERTTEGENQPLPQIENKNLCIEERTSKLVRILSRNPRLKIFFGPPSHGKHEIGGGPQRAADLVVARLSGSSESSVGNARHRIKKQG